LFTCVCVVCRWRCVNVVFCFIFVFAGQCNCTIIVLFYLFFITMEAMFISTISFHWNNSCHHCDSFFYFFHGNGTIASFYFLCFFWQLHCFHWTWISLSASNFSFNIFITVSRRFFFHFMLPYSYFVCVILVNIFILFFF
jgi:hypothetical protein